VSTILVIEDEDDYRSNICAMLRNEGYCVLEADDGQSGIETALRQALSLDLILCDIMMPEVDGYEVLQQLRESPETVDIPMIFLTARATQDDLRQGMELGVEDYLCKPFTRNRLLKAIEAQLSKQSRLRKTLAKQRQRVDELQSRLESLTAFVNSRDKMLMKFVQELRNPICNVQVAIRMMQTIPNSNRRDRYLEILRQEFGREVMMLERITRLQELLTQDNIELLNQFGFLRDFRADDVDLDGKEIRTSESGDLNPPQDLP